jgi:hypothetical protein
MATAPATPITRRQMTEVKAPERFTFTKLGQSVSGILLSIEPVIIKGKQTAEYLFQQDDGVRFTTLETADLAKKINPQMIGYFVAIRYERDDASFQKHGQSPMKIFKVEKNREKEAGF